MAIDLQALQNALNTGVAPSRAAPAVRSSSTNPLDDLGWAMQMLRQQRPLYQLYADYYRGRHRLVFATDRWQNTFGAIFRKFFDNLARTVVNVPADKLQVAGFQNATGEDVGPALDLWRALKLQRKSGEVHKEALRSGDAYVIAWRDEITGQLDVYPQRPDQCIVRYDPDRPDDIAFAMKWWPLTDGRVRANLFYPDRVLKLVTRKTSQYDLPQRANAFMDWTESGPPEMDNPYGRVPVFAFHNDADCGCLGQSELEDVIPLQDALNKAVLDLLVAMEFVSFPQRWATGLEVDVDPDTGAPKMPFAAGVDRLWAVGDTDTKFGQFDAADLGQFTQVVDSFRLEIARVSGTPLHYLMLNAANFPSGEAMKTAEVRSTAKVQDRQEVWGEEWAALMGFLLTLNGQQSAAQNLKTLWKPAEPRSEQVFYSNLLDKQQLGVPDETLWSEMGYTADEIEQFKAQADAKAAANAALTAQLFNAGDQTGGIPGAPGANAGDQSQQQSNAKPGNPGMDAMRKSADRAGMGARQ